MKKHPYHDLIDRFAESLACDLIANPRNAEITHYAHANPRAHVFGLCEIGPDLAPIIATGERVTPQSTFTQIYNSVQRIFDRWQDSTLQKLAA